MLGSRYLLIAGLVLSVLLMAAWIPFLATDHSLTSEIHSPVALTSHLDQHHWDDEVGPDHSHPQDHDHEDQYSLTRVLQVLVPLLAVMVAFFLSFDLRPLLRSKADASICLYHFLSRHKTIVLLN